jgi:predicted PurR-regulated permease PerM
MIKSALLGPAGPASRNRFIAFLLCAAAVLFMVWVGMLVLLLGGLLSYSLISATYDALLARRMGSATAKLLAGLGFFFGLIALIAMVSWGTHTMLHDGAGFHDLLVRMADILASARAWLPASINDMLPQSDSLTGATVDWLKGHAEELGAVSLDAIKQIGYALIGMILGALVVLSHDDLAAVPVGPVSVGLLQQAGSLRRMFVRVASAQVKISAVNTTLTAIYLMIVLPLFGVHLPLTKTLTTATFAAGLLPVVGNLVSNSAIAVISFGYSLPVAIASLCFLVGVHKLEYFLNARIVGHEINARSWEILCAMVVMERLFSLPGVVIAPIFYAWLKYEWQQWDRPVMPSVVVADVVRTKE